MFYTRGYFNDEITNKIRKQFEPKITDAQIDSLMEGFDYTLLTEDLGVFKSLSKKLLFTFKDTNSNKLQAAYGQNSKMTKVLFNNPTALEKAMVDEKQPGLIVYVDNKPIMSVSYKTYGNFSYGSSKPKPGWSGMGNDSKYDIKFQIDISEFNEESLKNTALKAWEKEFKYMESTMPKIKKAIAALIKTTYRVSAVLVSADENRTALQKDRVEAKKGAISMMKPAEIKKLFKDELSSKLKAFKLSKSDVTISKKEELAKIIESKLPKIFSIDVDGMKIYYKFTEARNIHNAIEFSVKGSDYGYNYRPEDTYIGYTISDESSTQLRKLIDAEADFEKYGSDKYTEVFNKYTEMFPKDIKIMIEVDGLTLKPSKIIYEKGWYY